MRCKFCKTNDLDSTRAHFFSDALIRSGLNIEGKLKRGDHEATVEFSRKGIRYAYFGDSVLPKKRQKRLGRAQTEEEIEIPAENVFVNRDLVSYSFERKFIPIETV